MKPTVRTSFNSATRVEEMAVFDRDRFAREYVDGFRPVVMRGLVSDWPLVREARKGQEALQQLLVNRVGPAPVDTMVARPGAGRRLFYADGLRGFNFTVEKLPLRTVIERLTAGAQIEDAPAIYAGAAALARHAPGFTRDHPLPIATSDATPRIWIGNRTQVSTHFDLSDNIAVVAGGRRRFLLFPPDATADLYVGPLNVTPGGQPVSMVDPLDPDLDRYPRFTAAMEKALVADLEPGDAIYIPTLWWHHVEALDPLNVLVNYWHNHAAEGGAFITFVHALKTIRDLPDPQRAAWREWFEHFIFGKDAAHAADHLPPAAQAVQGPASPYRDEAIRRYVIGALSR